MLGNPWEHFRRWDGTALATEFDAQYTLLTSTYENMSVRYICCLRHWHRGTVCTTNIQQPLLVLLPSPRPACLWLTRFLRHLTHTERLAIDADHRYRNITCWSNRVDHTFFLLSGQWGHLQQRSSPRSCYPVGLLLHHLDGPVFGPWILCSILAIGVVVLTSSCSARLKRAI